MLSKSLRWASHRIRRRKSGRVSVDPDRLARLNKAAWRLAQQTELAQVYRTLVDIVAELFRDVSAIMVSRFDPEQKLIYLEGCIIEGRQVDPVGFPPIPLEPTGQGPQSEAILTRRPVNCPDFQARLRISKVNISVGPPPVPLSAIYVPMLSGDVVLGVLQVQSYTAERFDEQDQSMLERLAEAAVIAVRNAAQLDALRRKTEQLEEVARLSESLLRSQTTMEALAALGLTALKLAAASRVAVFQPGDNDGLQCTWARGFERLTPVAPIHAMLSEAISRLNLDAYAVPRLIEVTLPPPIPLGIPARQYLAALPVVYGRKKTVIACLFEQERQMSPLDADALEAFVRQARITLEKLDQ